MDKVPGIGGCTRLAFARMVAGELERSPVSGRTMRRFGERKRRIEAKKLAKSRGDK